MSAHTPIRPAWTCAGCGSLWPCDTRRKQLIAEYDGAPVSLGLFMGDCFNDAMHDLPRWAEQDVYARFLGWLRTG